MKKYIFNAVAFVFFIVIILITVNTNKNRKEMEKLRTYVLADKIDSTARIDRHYYKVINDEIGIRVRFSEIYRHNNLEREYFAVCYGGKERSYSMEKLWFSIMGDYQIVSKDGKVSVKKDGEVLLTRYPDGKVETSSFLCFESRSGYYPALQALN